jgi:hypothetical protein
MAARRLAGRPIAGVRITATPLDGGRPRSATTRADGSYEVTGIRNGRFSIAASLPAQYEPHQPWTVTIDDRWNCVEADIEARIDGRISGQLLDEQAHQPPVRKAR